MTSNDRAAPASDIGMTFDCVGPTAQGTVLGPRAGLRRVAPPEGWDTSDAFITDQGVPPEEWATVQVSAIQPAISFLKVPEPKRAKNRLHLDVKVSSGWHVDDDQRAQRINAKVAELVAA